MEIKNEYGIFDYDGRYDKASCNSSNGKKKIWVRESFFKDEVLVTEGSRNYHTHANCYLSWKEVYKRKFKGWKVISLKDAEAQGLKECRFCQKYYDVKNDYSVFDDTDYSFDDEVN